MATLLTILKNWKIILIGVLAVALAFFIWRVEDLKADYAQERVTTLEKQNERYEKIIAENQAHNKRIINISNNTDEIKKKINEANIKGKTQNEEFYNLLNTIVERHNSRVRKGAN